jgi:hypothetical protein
MTAHHATIKFLYAVDCNDHGNELLIARSGDNEHIFRSYCEGSDDNDIFDVARSGCIASVRATTISQPSRDARTQQSNNLCAVGCTDDSNKRC